MKNGFLLFFILLTSSFCLSGIKISPAYIKASTSEKKQTLTIPITITNTSFKKTEYLDISVASSAKDKDEKWNYKGKNNNKNSLSSWIILSEKHIEIAPTKNKKITIRIKISSTKSGDYRGTVFITQNQSKTIASLKQNENKKNKSKSSTTLYAISKIAIPVVLRVTNKKIDTVTIDLNKHIALTKLTAKFNHQKSSLLQVNALIHNRSNFAIESTGSCELVSRKGISILTQPIHKVGTFANEKTQVGCIFNEYLPANTYKIKASIANTLKELSQAYTIERDISFSVTLEDEHKSARNALNREDNKLLTPLLITPPSIHLSLDDDVKKSTKRSNLSVKNLSDKTLIVRPYFLEMPQKKSSRALKIKPSRFILKPYSTKKISLISKHKNTPLFGKVVFSAKNHKDKIPAFINYTVQNDTQPKAVIHFQTTPTIKQLDSKVQVVAIINNGAKHTLDGISIQLRMLNTKTKLHTQHKAKRGKSTLLPNETTHAYFQLNPIDNGEYELAMTVRHHGNIVASNTQYLVVSEKNQQQHYTLINPDT